MIRNFLLFLLGSSFSLSSCAQVTFPSSSPNSTQGKKIINNIPSSTQTPTTTPTSSSASQSSGGIGTDQVVSALKEALSISANKSSSVLSVTDGFFKNQVIKILMPQDAKVVESKLRQIGLGDQIDQMILSMNRAAEEAAKDAAPIFVDAIKSMSFADAMGIVRGSNDAATQYLKNTTTAQLTSKFKPVIKTALDKVNATKYWSDIFITYNKIPFVQPVNSDLSAYVTQKALDGLYYTMAQEEAKIRKDPAATASDLIKSVFGKK